MADKTTGCLGACWSKLYQLLNGLEIYSAENFAFTSLMKFCQRSENELRL